MASKKENDTAELVTKHVMSAISPMLEGILARLTSVEQEFANLHSLITSSNDTSSNSIREELAQLRNELNGLNTGISTNGSCTKIAVRNGTQQSALQIRSVDENTVVAIQEAEERRKRQSNIIINGIPEDNTYLDKISSLFEQMNLEKPPVAHIKRTFQATRLGKRQNDLPRPVRLTLDPSLKRKVMKNSPLLRQAENCKNVFIIDDLTPAQSRGAYLLRKQQREVEAANNERTDDATGTNEVSSEEDNVNIVINYTSNDVNPQDAASNLLTPPTALATFLSAISNSGNSNDGWSDNDTFSKQNITPRGLLLLVKILKLQNTVAK